MKPCLPVARQEREPQISGAFSEFQITMQSASPMAAQDPLLEVALRGLASPALNSLRQDKTISPIRLVSCGLEVGQGYVTTKTCPFFISLP